MTLKLLNRQQLSKLFDLGVHLGKAHAQTKTEDQQYKNEKQEHKISSGIYTGNISKNTKYIRKDAQQEQYPSK